MLLPLIVALPQLLGLFHANPLLYMGEMAQGFAHGVLRGYPYTDPNSGYSTQALGTRAALDWLQGSVPWWNPYSGVGMPLAAEYQPAAFFPLTFLLLMPQGMVWEHTALQAIAGLGTYSLLRQLGLRRLAAATGGVLYSFNGTLAWFAHASALPVPFLPWMLLGIERARLQTSASSRGGWRLFALAMAMNLLAGFPETAYISGILALAWALLRLGEAPAGTRARFAGRVALGGAIGIMLAAPQILAFFEFLPHAYLAAHAGEMANAALSPQSLIPSLLAPYLFGPIFSYVDNQAITDVWGSIGGYVTVALMVVAAYGFVSRAQPLGWLLLGWIALALAKTFGIEPVTSLWNAIPGIAQSAFARYAQPSWELAIVILAAWGLDDLAQRHTARRAPLLAAVLVFVMAVSGGLFYGAELWPILSSQRGLRNSAIAAGSWATLSGIACLVLARRVSPSRSAIALAGLLVFDSILMFTIPTLSNPRRGSVDTQAVDFLRANIGLQRFFTLGPLQPNYGAYFGIASINHNYLPIAERWVRWVDMNLAPGLPDGVVFNGMRASLSGSATKQLLDNLPAYEWVGVKYVLTPGQYDPFAGLAAANESAPVIRKVYGDQTLTIFELGNFGPYFEAPTGRCTIEAHGRTEAAVDCPHAATLVRRELFFPDWNATVNGINAPITDYGGLFQAVAVPAGKSVVRYRYAPAHIGWAWLAMGLALAALVLPWDRSRWRPTPR